MAGLVLVAIVLLVTRKTWMPGTRLHEAGRDG